MNNLQKCDLFSSLYGKGHGFNSSNESHIEDLLPLQFYSITQLIQYMFSGQNSQQNSGIIKFLENSAGQKGYINFSDLTSIIIKSRQLMQKINEQSKKIIEYYCKSQAKSNYFTNFHEATLAQLKKSSHKLKISKNRIRKISPSFSNYSQKLPILVSNLPEKITVKQLKAILGQFTYVYQIELLQNNSALVYPQNHQQLLKINGQPLFQEFYIQKGIAIEDKLQLQIECISFDAAQQNNLWINFLFLDDDISIYNNIELKELPLHYCNDYQELELSQQFMLIQTLAKHKLDSWIKQSQDNRKIKLTMQKTLRIIHDTDMKELESQQQEKEIALHQSSSKDYRQKKIEENSVLLQINSQLSDIAIDRLNLDLRNP